MATENQSETEFFAVVETGRKGVEQALEAMHDELMAVAAAPIRSQSETWKARALAYVAGDAALKDVLSHRRGVWSVYQGLAKMAQMGLQPGGHFPHAYLVPYSPRKGAPKIAQPVYTAEGYKFAVLHGPQPVAREITHAAVRDGDEISINQATGEVSHSINPIGDRGKVLGVWVRIVPVTGGPQVKWYSRKELIAVRDTRSLSWKFNQQSSPWSTDEEAMMVKTAVKKALKPFAAEAEGLAMMYAEDAAARPAADEDADYTPPPRNVTDRAESVLDAAIDSVGEYDGSVDDSDAESVDKDVDNKADGTPSEDAPEGQELF